MSEKKSRVHFFASGRVQGVFFRESMKKKAQKLQVFGWVKNLKNGRVEAVLEGDENNVEKLAKWAKRGSFFSEVKNLELIREEYKGESDSFEIRYDL